MSDDKIYNIYENNIKKGVFIDFDYLALEKAIYGTNIHNIDVTNIINKYINNNTEIILINNYTFKNDPHKNSKKLLVIYISNLQDNIIIKENEILKIKKCVLKKNLELNKKDAELNLCVLENNNEIETLDFKTNNIYFNLKSNNIIFLKQLKKGKIKLIKNTRKNFSLSVPFTSNLKLEFPKLQVAEYYNQFLYYTLYINNISNIFLNNSPILNKIDYNIIHVINLDERQDRWNKISKIKLKKFKFKRYSAFKSRVGIGWEGCARSHIDLIKYAKQQELPYIIVAEDDFINIIDIEYWELRLIQILKWLSINKYEWEVFNGLPTGQNVDEPISILNKKLGLINLNGGYNTHFIIYNRLAYDKIIDWYTFYDPKNECKNNTFPDISNSNIRNYLLAIDVWLSNNTNMITTIPLLTNSNIDDSDIIGHHTDENNNNENLINDYNKWLGNYNSKLEYNNRNDKQFKEIIKSIKSTHTYLFYEKQIKLSSVEKNKIAMKEHFKENSQIVSHFIDSYNYLNYTEKLFGNVNFDDNSDVTVVITSCNRWSYLYKTLSSFIKVNSYSVKEIILIEDSGKIRMKNNITKYFPQVKLLFDGKKKGQINRIIELWDHVTTKYVFHMEDDWEFYHPFFIEKSKIILENNSEIFNVWIRDINDTNLHPIDYKIRCTNGIYYWYMALDYNNDWNGFTWNPTLMNKEFVYNEILKLKDNNTTIGCGPEIYLSNKFKSLNKRSAIIPGGFICHIGEISSCIPETNDIFKNTIN